MSKILVYRKIGDVYVKVREVDEDEFEWLKDEPDMKILAIYIGRVEDYSDSEEKKEYDFRAEL